jgi:hypothetical protein
VPIVLLAPQALLGTRALLHRGSQNDGMSSAEPPETV